MKLKVSVIIYSLFTLYSTIKAQNLANLDKKNGIRQFQLGSSFENHKEHLILEIDGKVKFYRFENNLNDVFLGHQVEKTILGFYQNKLYYIAFQFNTKKPIYTDLIYLDLEKLFGPTIEFTNVKAGPLKYDMVYEWKTEKITLRFDHQLANEYQAESYNLWMTSKLIEQKMIQDDF